MLGSTSSTSVIRLRPYTVDEVLLIDCILNNRLAVFGFDHLNTCRAFGYWLELPRM